jgi:hypothetical protein
MTDILNDIIDNIKLKPNKWKILNKWIIRISIILIGCAFVIGQIKVINLNRISKLEEKVDENTIATNKVRDDLNKNFDLLNHRIDKVYDDGYYSFNEYQIYTKKQIGLIIDYSNTNKDLLKQMIDLNGYEINKQIQNNLEKSKNKNILIKPVANLNYQNLMITINDNDDTIFYVTGAIKKYLDSLLIDDRYKIINAYINKGNSALFDIEFTNK